MSTLYRQDYLNKLKRISILFGQPQVQRPSSNGHGIFMCDAGCFVVIRCSVTAASSPQLATVENLTPTLLEGPSSQGEHLVKAYMKVVGQIRDTEAQALQNQYKEESVEEEHFRYPVLRDISTRGVGKIRRRA